MSVDQELLTELAHRNLLGVFGERDPQKRAAVIAEIYAEQVTFSDPDEVVVGRDALGEKAQRLLDQAPGFAFSPAGPVRTSGNLTMLAWHLGPEGQPPVASGLDVSIVEDGRIAHLYTLLDPPA
ncbi:nuclear transport factor 2 family protein [Actinoplanes sp. Pm04-4]|uniref:Nuclear transport factor 2 family protein n=1 Tax=Paractinoplanes pyxinae TaxID=2997416 RepID=A0ABT4AVJ2_9ACTN|nr:nuclear transport factor 2 family protein [Actinoplanes pyxinae]MCY1138248.1 nuclear transport factor 2 family protein [Actinoplanes pyxinae]